MNFKDYFSKQSKEYSRHRPSYPKELYKYLAGLCDNRNAAWDCATGNGQAAIALAEYFDLVYATDASEEQISNAFPHPKIKYAIALSENSGLPDNSVDLITVATAIHWFNHDNFHKEVSRVIKPGGKIATWNYTGTKINDEVDEIVRYFTYDILGKYWDANLLKVFNDETAYELPFKKLVPPKIIMEEEWEMQQLINFLCTWSAVQNYVNKKNSNPIDIIYDKLLSAWGTENEKKKINWKLLVRVYEVE
ncbi:MAG: class I SAM-dependent methyltransferase [Ignavibacteriae bacterium]|nr:MAG: class I SAM-dependent methyltransferase [Ignavibacteriota bacterium]